MSSRTCTTPLRICVSPARTTCGRNPFFESWTLAPLRSVTATSAGVTSPVWLPSIDDGRTVGGSVTSLTIPGRGDEAPVTAGSRDPADAPAAGRRRAARAAPGFCMNTIVPSTAATTTAASAIQVVN